MNSRDIARLAGVSQSTVSRVLQGRPEVSAASRAKVEAVLKEVEYAPNPHARAMRNGLTNAIGVVVGPITNPFYPEVLEAVAAVLGDIGKHMIVWSSDAGGEEAAVLGIRDRLVDGIIFTTARYQTAALHEALERKGPIVLLNSSLEGVACDQLTSDNAHGSAVAAQHLVERGHRRIAVVGGVQTVSTGRERREGFIAALERLGVPMRPEYDIVCDFTYRAGHDSATGLLSSPEPPTAIFCANDLLALGVLDAARDLHVRVPQQLSVIGYDNIRISGWSAYNLTTVSQPTGIMAELAVSMLLERQRHPERDHETRRYSAELIERGSTGPVASRTD